MQAVDPRVIDAAWAAVAALLPARPADTHPLGCHRRRIPDRDCFTAILWRLVTGCSWVVAGRISGIGQATLRRRRDEWIAAGVFDRLFDEALAGYDRIIGLDLSEVSVDGSLHKAPCGGKGTGRNPTTAASSAGSGRSPPTATASRSAGPSTAPTATTSPCSPPPCTPSKAAGYSPRSTRCTWTAATTPAPSADPAPKAASPTP
jgi:transposase